jgi:hypothetical protein
MSVFTLVFIAYYCVVFEIMRREISVFLVCFAVRSLLAFAAYLHSQLTYHARYLFTKF